MTTPKTWHEYPQAKIMALNTEPQKCSLIEAYII
jgi:hypothetical protein